MALLGNIVWFVLGGWWNFLVYAAFGLLFCMTIIGIPIGKALFQYAKLMVLPFGKVIVKETELKGKENVATVRRVGGMIANILWLPFGIGTFIANLGLMIVCAISIVGIPAAVVIARSCKFLLWPVGAKVVTKAEYDNIILRRTIAASINAAAPNAASYTPYSVPTSHTPVDRKYKVEDFFSKPAWIGVGIALAIIGLLRMLPIFSPSIGLGEPFIRLLSALSPVIGILILTALAILISWIRSKISSASFWGISFSSVSGFFKSIQDLFVTLLEDIPFLRVVFAVLFFFVGAIPGVIGLLIGATKNRDSRYPADAVNAIAGSENTFPANQPSSQYQPPTVVGTPYQQNSPNVLVKISSPLWMPGLPIVVTQADIAKTSPNSPDVSLLLSFQNLCDQPIIGVYFSARCYNLLQQELQPVPKQSVQDFTLNPGAVWTSQLPVSIPENDTRRIELMIHNVIMADGSIWNSDEETILSPLPEQQSLTLPAELYAELQRIRAQYSTTIPVSFSYVPHKDDGYWCCACGQLNLTDKCIKCGYSEETVFQIVQPEFLAEKRDARLQEDARIRKERKQAVVYQQEAIKNTAGKIGRKLSKGGATVVDKLCFFKDWLWYKALDLWDLAAQQGKDFFEKHAPVVRQKCANGFSCAKNKLAAFYTDTAKPCASKAACFLKEKVFTHWKKILIVTGTVVVVAVVSVVAVNHYQEYRAEQERIQQEEAARLEAERQQALAEEEVRRQQEEEEKRRLEEEQRKLEEERQKEENRKQLEADLPDIFQRAFDAYSNGQVSEDNRINSELTFAKMLIEGRSVTWEDTFRVQYLEWRENKILALVNQLIGEYEQIIAERPLYKTSYNDEGRETAYGLYYAGYHDFDNNQMPELLLLTAEGFPSTPNGTIVEEHSVLVEIYGEQNGQIVKYGEQSLYSYFAESRITLTKYQDQMFICDYYCGNGTKSSTTIAYYGVQGKTLCLAEKAQIIPGFDDELSSYVMQYYLSGVQVSEMAFNITTAGYVTQATFFEYGSGVNNRGVLTQPINRTIIANGQTLPLTEPLYMNERYTLAPVRPVLEALGIPVYVADDMLTILASTRTDTLDIYNYGRMWGMVFDEYLANFNDEPVSISAQMIDGTLYASIEPLVALFGAQWKYDPAVRTLTITMNTAAENLMTVAELEALVNFSYEDAEQILAQLGYWISGSEDEWDTRNYISNGTAFWEVYVLPFGVEYEAYDNGIVFVGNSIPVTVTSNGEVIW